MSGFFAAFLEQAGNRLLRLDPETLRRLAEFDGKTICLRLRAVDGAQAQAWYVLPSAAGVRLLSQYDGEPDVTISASAAVFARLLLGDAVPQAAGEMQLSGDIALGQRFQRVLREIDLDWEEELAQRIGDVMAHQVGNAARALRAWRRQAHATLVSDISEYLQEEARLLAVRHRVEDFLSAVDTLRADVDRLEKRIDRLQAPA